MFKPLSKKKTKQTLNDTSIRENDSTPPKRKYDTIKAKICDTNK